ncbi:MAG TPA: hypothetical protein VFB90_06495 [Dehalococcoidia bacterium]|nr:hypothetical protein [Dehalococcoidia bacterium]
MSAFELSPVITVSLAMIAVSLATFTAWNCIADMLRPSRKRVDQAARKITERLGRGLTAAKKETLYRIVFNALMAAFGFEDFPPVKEAD